MKRTAPMRSALQPTHRKQRVPHRFLEPIHNVKDGEPMLSYRPGRIWKLQSWSFCLASGAGGRIRNLGYPRISDGAASTGCWRARARAAVRPCGTLRVPAQSSAAPCPSFAKGETGGAYRDRTDDLKLAKLALSQLS